MGFVIFSCGWLFLLYLMYNMQAWVPFGAALLATIAFVLGIVFKPEYFAANRQQEEAIDNSSDMQDKAITENDYKAITYTDEESTYDGFHMQREEEYKDEYGDDAEDAIQDEWEEKK